MLPHKLLLIVLLILSASKIFSQQPAANLPETYLPLLKGKTVGLIVNQSSSVDSTHLVDFLLSKNIEVKAIFAPEHGFRGKADRGALIKNSKDTKTGLPIVSLHGKNKKPQKAQLKGIDILVFDIQDVGVRFFTYISTMHYAMEAAAENKIEFLVLDRPNPLGDYIAGPVLKKKFRSFVGMHPIPIVHGLTVGELALMIKGEKWINNADSLKLKIAKCIDYTHTSRYTLPIKPSPNLPNMTAIRLYPSLCLFEATKVSVGRGTTAPFQQVGFPNSKFGKHQFVPKDIPGMQINPIQEGKACFGLDLKDTDPWKHKFTLKYILLFRKNWNVETSFVNKPKWFNLLAGTDKLLIQLNQGLNEEQIVQTWHMELAEYKIKRKKYLLYQDFE